MACIAQEHQPALHDVCALLCARKTHLWPASQMHLPELPTIATQAAVKMMNITSAKDMCARWGMARQVLPKYACTTLEVPEPSLVHLQSNLQFVGIDDGQCDVR